MNKLKSPLLKINNLQTQFKTSEGIIKAANNVSFEINSLIINNQIVDNFFKIPQEEDL